MHMIWAQAAPSALAAFFASLVEFVEALTIVLAVGAVRGWRGAIGGAALALVVLLVLVAVLGPPMTAIPQDVVQMVLGALLLLFGLRWLRKAILRSAGVIPLHDEAQAYAKQSATLRAIGGFAPGWDRVAVMTSFKITLIEGIEVVFIVIAVGATGNGLLLPASLGALAALLLVILLGVALHRPVARIPENALKFLVGVMLCAFGTFLGRRRGWASTGPAASRRSPYSTRGIWRQLSFWRSYVARGPTRPESRRTNMNALKAIAGELLGLFVDDGRFAALVLAWLAACALLLPRLGLPSAAPPVILFVGLVVILADSALRRAADALEFRPVPSPNWPRACNPLTYRREPGPLRNKWP